MNIYEEKIRKQKSFAPKISIYEDKHESFHVTEKDLEGELLNRYDLTIKELEEILEEICPERLL